MGTSNRIMQNEREIATSISVGDYERFRDFFYRKTGIYFDDSKRYFVDKRILTRMRENGSPSFKEYFHDIRYNLLDNELQHLINCMTVNETYFFREKYQFDCMVNHLLNEIVIKKRGGPIKIWSLPSSTGEEAYSIAIYLLEMWPHINEIDVEIYASDIDSSVLNRARAGRFSPRSIDGLPKHILKKYFKKVSGNVFQANDDLRDSVEFNSVNIVDPEEMKRFRDFDLIFCRNMLIYFDDISRTLAAEAIYDALAPNGYVFLGHSESMSRISALFDVVKFPESIAYKKII